MHHLQSLSERAIDEIVTVEVQRIEEECVERTGGAADGVAVASERTHRVLERVRSSIAVDADRLAVEYDRAHRQRSGPLDDSRQAAGDVVQIARIDPDVVVEPVDLDARAIEFPLNRRKTDVGNRSADVGRTDREHRRYAASHLEPNPAQSVGTVGERRHRNQRRGCPTASPLCEQAPQAQTLRARWRPSSSPPGRPVAIRPR